MSFGFSVGDFVAVGALIVKIVDSLRGTQSEYQELIRELENLQRALSQVDKLKGRGDQAIAVDQIKCAALTCRYPLEDFLVKVQKYEKSLGLGRSVTKIRDAGRKVQYAFGKKDEATTLRSYLNIHIGTINMLMVRQSLEMLDVALEQTDKNSEELKERIEGSSRELREVRGNMEAQALAVRENNSIIQKLFWMVSSELAVPLKSLSQTVAKVCVSTQQIYTIMLEIRASLPGIDTRFTYFQAPVKVEDALGRVFSFSSECSIEALIAEIKARFKDGPGKTKVMAGDFEIFNAQNTDQVLTISGRNVLLPRMSIYMAIILEKEFPETGKCPTPHCASKTLVEAVGGGRTCAECKVWFDRASRKRKRDFEAELITKHVKTLADRNRTKAKRLKTRLRDLQEASGLLSDEDIAETEHSDSEETSISAFKRIRFETSLGQEKLYEAAEAVLNLLKAVPKHSKPFLRPVNKREAPDYHQSIKRPMDLSTMTQKLKTFQYNSKREIVDDLDLIWRNCLRYNIHPNHPLRMEALWMKKKASRLTVLIPDIVVKQTSMEFSILPPLILSSQETSYKQFLLSILFLSMFETCFEYPSDNGSESSWRPDNPQQKSPAPENPERLIRSSKSVIEDEEHYRKAQPSQGDAVLIGMLGGLNDSDQATKAGEVPLPQSDESDVEDQSVLEGKKRHPNPQASQGDAVLIGYMGGLNDSDQTVKAGEVPYPQIDQRRRGPNGRGRSHEINGKEPDFVRLAEKALPLVHKSGSAKQITTTEVDPELPGAWNMPFSLCTTTIAGI